MSVFFKNNEPFLEGVPINDIIDSYSTPFYVYSQSEIIKNYDNLKKHLSAEIFYAVKANSNQAILKLLNNCGSGADVVSKGELHRSLQAGFEPNKIIFEGVGKSKEDIEYAVNKNIRLINTESISEISIINEIGDKLNKKINIGLRLNPDIDSETYSKISTGKKTDKFGIGIKDLNDVLAKIKSFKQINLIGISCHIGSQIKDINIFEKVFNIMKNSASICLSKDISLEFVDLGGGFGVNYEKATNDLDIEAIGKLSKSIFNDEPYNISFEPGRYIVAKAGIIITKILTIKENGGINFLITDSGMQTLLRPAIYGAVHRIQSLKNLKNKELVYTVAGPICESSDIIVKNILLPEQKIENYLAILDVGAYGSVMASNYNSRGMPTEILVNEKNFAAIHIGEKITDIVKRDFIPKWL